MYGQWLMLYVPFRHPMDFIDEELLSKVPQGIDVLQLRCIATI